MQFLRFGFLLVTAFLAVGISVDAANTTTAHPVTKPPTHPGTKPPTPHVTKPTSPGHKPTHGPTPILPSVPTPAPSSAPKCPEPAEIIATQCTCYPGIFYIVCDNITSAFALTKPHFVNQLVIKNTADLPLLTSHTNLTNKLTVGTLVILQDVHSPSMLPTMDNLEELFSISTKAIKVISHKDLNASLDVSTLPEYLQSITIIEVNSLEGFEFDNFPSLSHLLLRDVTFTEEVNNVPLIGSSLKSVEITNVGKLKGGVNFSPASCTPKEKIHIKITNNPGLTGFDFSDLFPSNVVDAKTNCKYHIDLSNNAGFPTDLLSKQAQTLNDAPAKRLYLIMRSSKDADCDCELVKASIKHQGYLNGIHCVKPGKYLDECSKTDVTGCA